MSTDSAAVSYTALPAAYRQSSPGGAMVSVSDTGEFLLALLAAIGQINSAGGSSGENVDSGLSGQLFPLLQMAGLPDSWSTGITGSDAGDGESGSAKEDHGRFSELPVGVWWQLLSVSPDNPAAGMLAQVLPGLLNQELSPEQMEAMAAGLGGQSRITEMPGVPGISGTPEAPGMPGMSEMPGMAGQSRQDGTPQDLPAEKQLGYYPVEAGVKPPGAAGNLTAFDGKPGIAGAGTQHSVPEAVAGELPVTEFPVSELPVTEFPVSELPVTEFPVSELPVTGTVKTIPGEAATANKQPAQTGEAAAAPPAGAGPDVPPDGPVGPEGRIQRLQSDNNYDGGDTGRPDRSQVLSAGQKTASGGSAGEEPGPEFSDNGRTVEITVKNAVNPGDEAVTTMTTHLSRITAGKLPEVIAPHLVTALKQTPPDGNRVTVIRLKLEPENLGEIQIKLSYTKGELTAHFYTASGLVRDAVEGSLVQLREALSQYNVNLGEAAAFVGHDQHGHNGAAFAGNGYGRPMGYPGGSMETQYNDGTTAASYSGDSRRYLDLLV